MLAIWCGAAPASANQVSKQAIPQFWFKPGAFRWHHFPAVCDIKKLLDSHRVETEGDCHFSAVNSFFKFTQTTYSSYKIDPGVCSLIFDSKNRIQQIIGKYSNVQ